MLDLFVFHHERISLSTYDKRSIAYHSPGGSAKLSHELKKSKLRSARHAEDRKGVINGWLKVYKKLARQYM